MEKAAARHLGRTRSVPIVPEPADGDREKLQSDQSCRD